MEEEAIDDLHTGGIHNEDVEESDDEELITAQEVLASLEAAWMNEKLAPDILPHQTDILDLMLGQISHMEENIRELEVHDLRAIAHKMELDRIKYIVASYLRCRLAKIEEFAQHILNEEEKAAADKKRLSQDELKFAKEYVNNTENCFNQIALQYLPPTQRGDADQRLVRPNLMSHVFVKAIESTPAVVVGMEDEEVDLTAGSQHIIPYQLISDLICKGSAQLI